MPEKTPDAPTPRQRKFGRWFRRIPKDILLSPGGFVLIAVAAVIELIDIIPIPLVDNLWELPLEFIFTGLVVLIAKVPLLSMAIPMLLERIPIFNDVVPTFLIRLFL